MQRLANNSAVNPGLETLLAEIDRVREICSLYQQLGSKSDIDVRRAVFDMQEDIVRAEMIVEFGGTITDELDRLRQFELQL